MILEYGIVYHLFILNPYNPSPIMTHSIPTKDVVKILEDIAILLELQGENPFKSKAYARAARNIETMDQDLGHIIQEGTLSSIEGIGPALDRKITELVTTGRMEYYEQLRATIPGGLTEMLRIQGLGPKKAGILYRKLGIASLGELEYACMENRLVDLQGFGRKTQDGILAGIVNLKRYKERHLYARIIEEAEELCHCLTRHNSVSAASLAGSLRRRCPTVRNIDLVVSTDRPSETESFFLSLDTVDSLTARGSDQITVLLKSGVPARLHIVVPSQFPCALFLATGSDGHRRAMTERAGSMGITISTEGLFRNGSPLRCDSEDDIYTALAMSFVPPELREDRGECDAARTGAIPRLITAADIRGLFHIHSTYSDGSDTIDSMAARAREMGFEYIGISDHSKSASYAGGLSIDDIRTQHEEIDRLNEGDDHFHIFKGIESDILPDGSLDYDDDILRKFDFVIAAVHSHFTMNEDDMNARILKALAHPRTTMLAHPTGRLLLAREPYHVDIRKIIDYAAQRGTVCELNANPCRLDLDWESCRYAKERGVTIAINPDAHNIDGLRHVSFGINVARKGWLSSSDCVNCLGLNEVRRLLSKQ